jgi:predicted DCC family thiol-disulfide oxidoreductase YuxK
MSRVPFSFRDDPAVPAFPDDRPIIIFDGKCALCSGFARFILWADRKRRFRFLAAQTPIGVALYRHYGLDPVNYTTNILLADGRVWFKSAASLRIFQLLGVPWMLLSVGWLLPRRLRDGLYDIVARNRLRWFGVRETCYLPDRAQADRFLG